MYLLKFILILFVMTSETFGDIIFKDNFTNRESWKLITDQVMGGISTGEVTFINTKKNSYVNLKGNVSTKNRGGFIQIRSDLRNVNLEELGNSALYLVSDMSSAVTGEIHFVDCGFNIVGMPKA